MNRIYDNEAVSKVLIVPRENGELSGTDVISYKKIDTSLFFCDPGSGPGTRWSFLSCKV
ncbi:MAG: hypothetical protein LUD02_08840 [Tannerellaceae bacterium]|nr:hypothetical protein [Tannerellaceae bacterium]